MENITAGEAEVEAKLDGIKLYSHMFDLCKDVLPQVNLNCPVAAGQHSITIKTKIPAAAPRVRNCIILFFESKIAKIIHKMASFGNKGCRILWHCMPQARLFS